MASFKIFRKGGLAMSGILNVLGMAVAFAVSAARTNPAETLKKE